MVSKSPIISAERKERESSQALLRRFTQYVQKRGVTREVRANQFFTKAANRNARRKSALVVVERRKEYDKMRKMGKVK